MALFQAIHSWATRNIRIRGHPHPSKQTFLRNLIPVLKVTEHPFYYGRALPDEDPLQGRGAPRVQHSRPWVFYARETYFRGTACRFSHEAAVNTPWAKNSRRPCSFFVRGHCRRGEACNFSHDQSSEQDSTEVIEVFIWSLGHWESWLIRTRMMTVSKVGLVSLEAPGPSSETVRQSWMSHSPQTFQLFKYAIFRPMPQQAQSEP